MAHFTSYRKLANEKDLLRDESAQVLLLKPIDLDPNQFERQPQDDLSTGGVVFTQQGNSYSRGPLVFALPFAFTGVFWLVGGWIVSGNPLLANWRPIDFFCAACGVLGTALFVLAGVWRLRVRRLVVGSQSVEVKKNGSAVGQRATLHDCEIRVHRISRVDAKMTPEYAVVLWLPEFFFALAICPTRQRSVDYVDRLPEPMSRLFAGDGAHINAPKFFPI